MRGYLPKVIYRRPPHLSIDFTDWATRHSSYLNRYGHILRQPEIRTRQDKLQRFLAAHSEVAAQTPLQIYCAFADSLPVIHAYRALCLTAGQYKQMASAKEPTRNKLVSWFSNFVSWQGATNAHSLSSVIEERRSQGAKGQTKWVSYFLPAPKRILAKGAYKKSLAACIAHEIAFGYWRGVRSRLHLDFPLPLDFTLSLHGGKQIALAVALYSWRAGDKIYLFTVEIPQILVLDLRIPQVSPNTHYFWFMDIPFNADEPDLEFFVLNKIDFVPFVKSVQVFADPDEIRRELVGLQARQQARYDADKQAYLHSAAPRAASGYRHPQAMADRLKGMTATITGFEERSQCRRHYRTRDFVGGNRLDAVQTGMAVVHTKVDPGKPGLLQFFDAVVRRQIVYSGPAQRLLIELTVQPVGSERAAVGNDCR